MRMTSRTTGLMTITMNRMEHKALRVIISGGGTGGHIFPAVSIANKLKEQNPKTEILFVGAEGKMEMATGSLGCLSWVCSAGSI